MPGKIKGDGDIDLSGFVTEQIERTVTLKSHHDGIKYVHKQALMMFKC